MVRIPLSQLQSYPILTGMYPARVMATDALQISSTRRGQPLKQQRYSVAIRLQRIRRRPCT